VNKKSVCRTVIVLLVVVPFWVCCASFLATPIDDLLKNPRKYEGKTVTINGMVIDSQALVVVQYFTLEDETGSIRVITDRALPRVGQSERVKGKIKAYSFGPTRMTVLIEEPIEE
jgi:aspartyl/asparaginyl-tRNA synthetase